MTDAERLTRGYFTAICQAPFRIAPERAQELNDQVFAGKPCDLHFIGGKANFFAHVGSQEISASFAALLSLWAVSHASLELSVAVGQARRDGLHALQTGTGTPAHDALLLVQAARTLIADPTDAWPVALPTPDPLAAEQTRSWRINNLFLGAVSWALRHEVGHLVLKHEMTLPADQLRKQEFEADTWATQWVLAGASQDLAREFRVFCVATGLAWLGLVQAVRGEGPTHPPAPQRFLNCAAEFLNDELSPAIEMAGDVLKTLFDPSAQLEVSEHPLEAFERLLLHLRGVM